MSYQGNNPKVNSLTARPQAADPTNPTEGMVFYSDGTPRAEGLWKYINGAWVKELTSSTSISVDNTIVTYDGTSGSVIQGSSASVSDVGDITSSRILTPTGDLYNDENLIIQDSSDFINSIGSWVRYKNAGATPTNGIGGTPDAAFLTRMNTRGPASLGTSTGLELAITSSTNCQGNGVSLDITLPSGFRDNLTDFYYYYASASNFVTGDYKIFYYDITNSTMLVPDNDTNVQTLSHIKHDLIRIPPTCTSIRVIIHCVTTNTADNYCVFQHFKYKISGETSVVPEAELIMSTAAGRGSTNTVVLRYNTTLINTADKYVVHSDSATLGSTFTILQNGNYEISMQYESSDASREFGITRNCSTLTTNITLVAPSQIIASGVGVALRRSTITKTVNLNIGDIIRGQDDQGAISTGTDDNRFSIKFLGYNK